MNLFKLFTPRNWKKIYVALYHLKEQAEKIEKLRKRFPAARIPENLEVTNPQNLHIGQNTGIGTSVILKCGEKNTGTINLGNNVVLGSTVYMQTIEAPITIEDFCDIGLGTKIVTYQRDTKTNPALPNDKHVHIHEPVTIGKACMVAAGSIILGGTTLGENCIISAGSVVKGNFPANSVLIGNPARVLPRTDFF